MTAPNTGRFLTRWWAAAQPTEPLPTTTESNCPDTMRIGCAAPQPLPLGVSLTISSE